MKASIEEVLPFFADHELQYDEIHVGVCFSVGFVFDIYEWNTSMIYYNQMVLVMRLLRLVLL